MKKIIFLAIGLLFASVHAVDHSAEIIKAAVALAHHRELVASVSTLCKQGLTIEQIVAQLVHNDKMCAYFGLGGDSEESKPMGSMVRKVAAKQRRERMTDIIFLTIGTLALLVLVINTDYNGNC